MWLSDKPGRPGIPEISEVTDDSMVLNWTPPKEDGGCPIDGYVIESKVEGSYKWKTVSKDIIPETTFKVKGLMTDLAYEFRVSAVNKAGQGPCSENSQSVKAKAPLGRLVPCSNTKWSSPPPRRPPPPYR